MDVLGLDLLAEIMLRLPPSSLRRCRLVCRLWRDLVHERAPKSVPLVVTTKSAYLVDLAAGSFRELWSSPEDRRRYGRMHAIGACDGIVGLCDNTKPGGAIILLNPATVEALEVPPFPGAAAVSFRPGPSPSWHEAYSFTCHPTTGQYKIVHVPSPSHLKAEDTVHVFTLGEASWRDVPAPDARCRLGAGFVSVDGAMYWVTEGTEKIVSFDMEDERVRSVASPPSSLKHICNLSEVRGRLGIVVNDGYNSMGAHAQFTEVWALDGERTERRWRREYCMLLPKEEWLLRPHLAHGRYILSQDGQGYGRTERFRASKSKHTLQFSFVDMSPWNRRGAGGVVLKLESHIYHAFPYVQTREPLSVYRRCVTVGRC